jgi:hypothetical protein
MIRRNVASQTIYLPQLVLAADGTAVTSSATLTVAKDGVEASSAGTLAHVANGVWKYTPTQAETDAAIVGLVLTAADAVPVVLNLVTTAANTQAVAFGANTVTPDNATIGTIDTRTSNIYTVVQLTDADVSSIRTTVEGLVAAIWSNATRTLTAISDSSGITTLLSRIAGTIRTAADDVTAETAQTTAIRSGLALEATLDAGIETLQEDIAAIEGGGGGLTGDYTLTVTVTDADTEQPIEAATVTLFRTGERGAEQTDDEGVATFGVNAATWTWVVRASGYQSATGTKVIAGNDTLAVELTAIVVEVPEDPALATLSVKCLDESGAPEPGAVVYVKLVGIPTGSTGLSFDGISQEATAGSDGIATLTIVKLAKYEIRRGDSKQWKPFTATSDNSQTITSFIGVDPA